MIQQIRQEILAGGPLPFARFMELTLNAYYEEQKEIGRRGDFYTSVSVGPVFGELLAFQFAEWTDEFDSIQLVEAGAHQGHLAADILGWLRQWRPEIFARVQYIIVEPSAVRRSWQEETLREFAGKITWLPSIPNEVNGIIFSNELLDAMPVHRLCWHAVEKRWLEWKVGWDGGKFIWEKGEPGNFHLPQVPPALAAVLPDEFIVEISPAAIQWWRAAAQSLKRGKLLAIDYGLTAEQFFQPERRNGTLRAYSGHHVSDDLLANPGKQDLTAHVNFTALQEASGLNTELLVTQAKILTGIFEKTLKGGFAPWDSARVKQFQTLTHPAHLGRPFQVLVQGR